MGRLHRLVNFGKLEVSPDQSEPRVNPDDTKLVFCGERSPVTLYRQKRKQNSTALQFQEENLDVATENDVSQSRMQNVVQRLSSEYKFFPIGCTENIGNKRKNFDSPNFGNSLYLLIMIMDDSTTFQEEQIQNRVMKRLENELSLTYIHLPTLMRKCVAEQILGNWLKTFSTYLELYFGCLSNCGSRFEGAEAFFYQKVRKKSK